MSEWSKWRPFPDPRQGGYLTAPFGPGVYELHDKGSDRYVLCGIGGCVAYRMCSLLPAPFGRGTRNNQEKRDYVLDHLQEIKYRTVACPSRAEASEIERKLRSDKDRDYIFPT